MLTRKDIIDFCMTLGGVYEDYPFDDPNWTLMRHVENKKTFANTRSSVFLSLRRAVCKRQMRTYEGGFSPQYI